MRETSNRFFLIVEHVNKMTRYSIGERLPGDRIVIAAKCPNEYAAKQLMARLEKSTEASG